MANQARLPTVPQGRELDAAQRLADEEGACARAFPPAHVWKREFPKEFKGDVNGKFSVGYKRDNMTQFERDRNSAKVQAMIANWQTVGSEAAGRRSAEIETVTVRGRDGVTMHLPARLESSLAKKDNVKPVRRWGRGTKYWIDTLGNRWRLADGAWVPDEVERVDRA